jgi:hypothetical protein
LSSALSFLGLAAYIAAKTTLKAMPQTQATASVSRQICINLQD